MIEIEFASLENVWNWMKEFPSYWDIQDIKKIYKHVLFLAANIVEEADHDLDWNVIFSGLEFVPVFNVILDRLSQNSFHAPCFFLWKPTEILLPFLLLKFKALSLLYSNF